MNTAAVTCDAPATTPDVVLTAGKATYNEGEVLNFSCAFGMQRQSGDWKRTCLATGELSGTQLTCASKGISSKICNNVKHK